MARPVTLRAYDDGIDRWEMANAPPAAPLAPFVRQYTHYWERTGSFSARRELASTRGVLIVNLGDPLEIVGADGGQVRLDRGQGFVGGLAGATSISRSTGAQCGVDIDLSLSMIGRLLGCPPAEIANRVVTLSDAMGAAARDLGERLAQATSAEARFDSLDSFILERIGDGEGPDRRMEVAAATLRRQPDMPVATLAERLNIDRRDFARRFRRTLGVSPRHYARLARFEAFVAAISAEPTAALADLAVAAGYFDQPHLNRDVRGFADMTPAQLRERVVPGGGGVRHE